MGKLFEARVSPMMSAQAQEIQVVNWLKATALISSLAALGAGPAVTLRQAVGDRMLIGGTVAMHAEGDPKYLPLVIEQFNCVTAENDFKPQSLQPGRARFTFETADKYVELAAKGKIKLIGHTLVWHAQSPAFLFQDAQGNPLPREEALANMKTHITTVMTHFKGKVHGWDVVNEALGDGNDYLRSTPALRAIGEDYLFKAFEYAHAADSAAELYYNDYSIEGPRKRGKALRLLKSLKAANVPITAVGIQGHFHVSDKAAIENLDKAIEEFAALGLKVMITELDVDVLPRKSSGADVSVRETGADPYKDGLPQTVAEEQGRYYADVFRVIRKHADVVTRVTFWGTTDGHSWLDDFPVKGRTNHPLLWARDGSPKPAFNEVLKAMHDWPATTPTP